MTVNLFLAIGTRRGKAERWIAELPQRYPHLGIQTVSRNAIATLAPDSDAVILVEEPYNEIGKFQEDVRTANSKGFQVYAEYFPAEPMFTLIQADMQHRESALGAAILKGDIQELRTEQAYYQVLEKENPI
ncbi:hypothetical protein ACSSZE_03050 [Acidithiobacillus caldus]